MLSVLIETRNHEDPLARTLASLVGGAVEGVVKEVVICDRGSTDRTCQVADLAGCAYLENADIAAGIRRAKGDWLLFLEPGARLNAGWMEPLSHHVATASLPARFTRARNNDERFLSRFFSARRPLADGLIITRRQAGALAKAGSDAQALARSVSAKRLSGEILNAPR